MATIGYARVSTKGQSLTIQLAELKKSGATKIFQEKASAKDSNRDQLNALLDYMREGDVVVVTKLDRIARSTKDLLNIVEIMKCKRVSFKVLNINLDTSTPTGKLMLTLLGAIAEFERELMLERQADGVAKAKAEGKYTGRQPTARKQSKKVIELLNDGKTKKFVAEKLGIGVASVYRIAKAHKENTSCETS